MDRIAGLLLADAATALQVSLEALEQALRAAIEEAERPTAFH